MIQWQSENVIGPNCDMGSNNANKNMTSLLLLQPQACGDRRPKVEKRHVSIQILESKHFNQVTVVPCKNRIRRKIRWCSFWGNLEPANNGLQAYSLDISHEQCIRMHEIRIFNYDSIRSVKTTKLNDSTSLGMYLAGDAIEGACNTGSYSDPGKKW